MSTTTLSNLQKQVTKLETQLEGTKKHIHILRTRYDMLQVRDLQKTVYELSQQLVDTVKEVNTLETRCEQLETHLAPVADKTKPPNGLDTSSRPGGIQPRFATAWNGDEDLCAKDRTLCDLETKISPTHI